MLGSGKLSLFFQKELGFYEWNSENWGYSFVEAWRNRLGNWEGVIRINFCESEVCWFRLIFWHALEEAFQGGYKDYG